MAVGISEDQYRKTQAGKNLDIENNGRSEKVVYGFWQCARACIFNIQVTDLVAARYRGALPEQFLMKQDLENKTKYLKHCIKMHKEFTSLFYIVVGMVGEDMRAAKKRLLFLLDKKWHQGYSDMVGFVPLWMSLAVVRLNNFPLKGHQANHLRLIWWPMWEC